jgi:hypothetical protein
MERVNLRRLPDEWSATDMHLLQAVDDATATPVYIAYSLADEWFEGLHATLDELEDHILRRPTVALDLIEHALHRLDRASGAIDDSDGGLVDAGERLREMFRACSEAAGVLASDTSARLSELAALELWPPES